jgi:hypothetical protein
VPGSAATVGRSVLIELIPEGSRVTLGRAADLVGQPVTYSRPIRSGQNEAGLFAPLHFSRGILSSRMPVAAYGLTESFGLCQYASGRSARTPRTSTAPHRSGSADMRLIPCHI